MSTTVDANISMSSSLDNGMSIAGLVSLDEGGVDDSGWSISGDFGKVAFGDTANDGFGATNTGLTADEGTTLSANSIWGVHNDCHSTLKRIYHTACSERFHTRSRLHRRRHFFC